MTPNPIALRLVVMGVSGCGKSTLANALGQTLALDFTDGDDLHLPSSVEKMQSGVPLTDEDRWPWLDRVAACLVSPPAQPELVGRVVACSALKRVYRDRLRQQVPELQFVFLEGTAELLRQRMAQRVGHFMQSKLLDSQFATLERPAADERDVIAIQANQTLQQQIAQVCAALLPSTPSLPPTSPTLSS